MSKGGHGVNHRGLNIANRQGFTIIEVMIVLAVTGVLFASAAVLISGKQNQTSFDQSIREIHSQIQQTINEVAIGFYPNSSNFQCIASTSGPVISPGTASQGTNAGCIFVGKAMQFKVGTDPEKFSTLSIAGLQQIGGNGPDVTALDQAKPKVVDTSVSSSPLQNGLTVLPSGMWYDDGVTTKQVGAVAFTSSLAPLSTGSGLVSGSQQVNVVPINNSTLGQTVAEATAALNTNIATSPVNPKNGVFICFVSGGTKQSGLITIGSKSRNLAVTLAVKSNTTCA